MRILVASSFLPWPLNSGGNAAQFSTFKCLAQDHQFTLVCPVYDEMGMAHARELQEQLPQVTVRAVFCGLLPPPKPKPLVQVARAVVHVGRQWLNPPVPSFTNPDQSLKPTYAFDPLPAPFIAALEEVLAQGADLCQLEFVPMLSLGAWLPREMPKLFVHHQVHFVYSRRFVSARGADAYAGYLDKMWQVQEIAYLREFQGVITFSAEDEKHLAPYLAPEKLFVSPFPIPADTGFSKEIPTGFNGEFLFLASEGHGPNHDALEWLLANIWPEILRQMPSARLTVIGQWSELVKTKYALPGVTFAGFVKDLSSVLRGGIMLVPLRIGSGIRVKIMVAMAQGVPVVSTSVGCEGLFARDGEELLVSDDAAGFATAAVRLAQDPELWKRLATAGQAAAIRHYSPEQVRQRRNEIYAALAQGSRG